MKRFLVKCLVYAVVAMLSIALFLRILVSFPNEYSRQSHEVNAARQIERIQTIDEPKIIIIGGSGCGFGLCSPVISDHFQMPVCNTGTHGGMGLSTELNLFKPYIHKDDIVVVIPEYYSYLNNNYLGEKAALRILSSTYPIGYKVFSLRQQLYLIQHVPSAFKDALISRKTVLKDTTPYSMKALNEYGDVECYENRSYKRKADWYPEKWSYPKFRFQEYAVAALMEYDDYCKEKGAIMLVFPSAFKAVNFDVNKDFVHAIWESMEKTRLHLVSCPEQYRMDDSLFFDNPYHLNHEGVAIRTNQLIMDMDSALRVYKN